MGRRSRPSCAASCRCRRDDRGLKEALLARDRGRERVGRGARADRADGDADLLAARAGGRRRARRTSAPFDVPMMHFAVGFVAERTRDVAPDYWERMLTILLDGMSRGRAPTTPMPVAPLDREAFTEAMAGAGRRRT